MRIETHMQSVTLTDIPEPSRITQILVNLQDMFVEVTYEGHQPTPFVSAPPLSIDAASDMPEPLERWEAP